MAKRNAPALEGAGASREHNPAGGFWRSVRRHPAGKLASGRYYSTNQVIRIQAAGCQGGVVARNCKPR